MTRLLLTALIVTVFFSACVDKEVTVQTNPIFESFEMSYTNGWTKSFTLKVDSNKIYFSPQHFDTIYYGVIPDSLLKIINTACSKIHADSIVSKDESCVDCAVFAIKIIDGNDTTRVYQAGDLDVTFYPLVESLQKFIDSTKHQTIHAVFSLDTKFIVAPLPPKIDDIKFKPPIATEKSGR